MQNPIYVTKPSLPPLEEFLPHLQEIWKSKVLTNNGPYHSKLEVALREYLGIQHLSLFTNATIALVTALQALRITGEVITTPYSFVATAHSILWNNLTPVFVDIDERTCNINPSLIEAAITPRTSAILPVHCYGLRANVEEIQSIANNYGLKVIYDAAHAFGVSDESGSILRHGDVSIASFHATKVFNTFEGGAIICPDEKTKRRIDFLKNFGFADEVTVTAPGINGKMNEFSAALGLTQLSHVDADISRRMDIVAKYCDGLSEIPGVRLLMQLNSKNQNGAYFPIFIERPYSKSRDELYHILRTHGIFARRYFYPLISTMPMYRTLESAKPSNLIIATKTAESVLCLPLYPSLEESDVTRIVSIIRNA